MGNGKRLQSLLKDKNVSVASLSRDTGISQNTLYALIKRDSEINSSTMAKIAQYFHISVDELSSLLSDDIPKADTQTPSRVLESDFEETIKDTQKIIEKINQLSKEYEYKMHQYLSSKERLEMLNNRKSILEQDIAKTESEIALLQNDIKNRAVELSLIREKLS